MGNVSKLNTDNAKEITELTISNATTTSSEDGKKFGLTDPNGWTTVSFLGPKSTRFISTGFDLDYRRSILIYACSIDDKLIATGNSVTSVSRVKPAAIIALLVVILLYSFAAFVVWRYRNGQTVERKVQSPQRWQDVDHIHWWRCLDPAILVADSFDNASLSKLQVLAFTLLVVFGLCLIGLRTGVLTNLSPSVGALLGLPAFGAIGAGLATLSRDRLSSENWAWLVSKGVLPVNDRGKSLPSWTDMFTSDGELDLYRIQAAAFSIVVALGMLQAGLGSIGTFSVPDTFFAI